MGRLLLACFWIIYQAGSQSYCTAVVMSNPELLEWADVHGFHRELIGQTLLKLILMSL